MKRAKKIVTFLVTMGLMVIGAAALLIAAWAVVAGFIHVANTVGDALHLRPASIMATDEPMEGVGRVPVAARYLGSACAGEAETARLLETYTDGDSPVPAWYQPEEDMAVEWRQTERHDIGCPDWNVDTTLYGWDGRTMEAWEMDVFSRVMYLEFWGTSPECCEAGCDAILRLWESGYYGDTMYGVLSAETEVGGPVFETWDAVWGTTYDPDGLWEMRSLCEERFRSGPEWIAPFFRTGHYHDWAVPAYEIDGVYFSTGCGW